MDTLRITDYFIASILAFIGRRGGPAWLVGGFVRDALIGRPVHDLDLIVPAGAIELARAISRAFGGAFFVLDEERDVARTIVDRPDGEPLDVDVARLRDPDLLRDLSLRDFTINAMAAPVPAAAALPGAETPLVDPFDGRGDLARGLIRVVSPEAFRDDPLRTLRGVRQAVEFGFRLDADTCDLARRDSHLLVQVAAERVRDELQRIMVAPGAWEHLRLLARLDLLRPTLPETQALIGVAQSAPHYLDVFDHTRAVLAHAERILALLWPNGAYQPPADWPAGHTSNEAAGAAGSFGDAGQTGPQAAADGSDPGPDISADAGNCAGPLPPDPILGAPQWQWDELAETLAPYAADLAAHLLQPLAAGRTRRDIFPWAALAHDWGKPATRSVGADWRVHFYGHDHLGASLAENRLRLLAFSANEAAYVGQLVDLHMRPGQLARHYPPTQRALYHFFRDAGPLGPDVTLLALADKMATHAPQAELDRDFWRSLLGVTRQVCEAYFRAHATRVNPAPLLDGRAIMAELGLSPGPQVGRVIEALREAQAVGEVTTVDEAREWLHNNGSNQEASAPA